MFYQHLNTFIEQLEQQLDAEVDYQKLAKSVGINFATLQKVFPLLAGISLADYVRRRRLTLAGKDLVQTNYRIIDIATKYGYTSSAAFSRAFQKFHGLIPSQVRQNISQLSYYPKIHFTEPASPQDFMYAVIQTTSLQLCGLEVTSDHRHIQKDAPALFTKISREYPDLPHPDFGVLDYELGRDVDEKYHYYALWRQEYISPRSEFVTYQVPSTRWLKFTIDSQSASAIQAASTKFYESFLPTCEYQLRPEPDLEYYHDGITELWVPIY